MGIFLTKTHHFPSEGLYSPSGVVWITFMMVGCAFWTSKSGAPFTNIIKFGRARRFI